MCNVQQCKVIAVSWYVVQFKVFTVHLCSHNFEFGYRPVLITGVKISPFNISIFFGHLRMLETDDLLLLSFGYREVYGKLWLVSFDGQCLIFVTRQSVGSDHAVSTADSCKRNLNL